MSEMLKVANSVLKLMVNDERPYGVKADNAVNLGLLLSRGQQTAAELREFVDQMAGA